MKQYIENVIGLLSSHKITFAEAVDKLVMFAVVSAIAGFISGILLAYAAR